MIGNGENLRITHQHRHKIKIPIREYTSVESISAPEISAKSSNFSLLFHAAAYATTNTADPYRSIQVPAFLPYTIDRQVVPAPQRTHCHNDEYCARDHLIITPIAVPHPSILMNNGAYKVIGTKKRKGQTNELQPSTIGHTLLQA